MALIRRIEIDRFRCLERFSWQPHAGVNVLVGQGDVGKSTVLSALELFLRRRPLTEFDYYKRRTEDGFLVRIVVTGLSSADLAAAGRSLPVRGWSDDGRLLDLAEGNAESALVFQASGTADLDLEYHMVAASSELFPLYSSLRQQLRILSLLRYSDETASVFRMTASSLLSRNFPAPSQFRQAARSAIQHAVDNFVTPPEVGSDLDSIRTIFESHGLPHELLLGLYPLSGAAASQSVAAFAGASINESVPIELAGDGTRKLAMLALASRIAQQQPILLIDELEASLEPHRQRVAARLVTNAAQSGQSFVVTHAPAVVSALAGSHHWRMSCSEALYVPPKLSSRLFQVQPEAAFARLSVVCEGDTEVGLAERFWAHYTGQSTPEAGVVLVNAGGHEKALSLLVELAKARIPCAGFVDNESTKSGTRAEIAKQLPLFTWHPQQNPEEALATWLPVDKCEVLVGLICESVSRHRRRLETKQVSADIRLRLECADKLSLEELFAKYGEPATRKAISSALNDLERIKDERVARDVADWLIEDGIPLEMDNLLRPFFKKCEAARQ